MADSPDEKCICELVEKLAEIKKHPHWSRWTKSKWIKGRNPTSVTTLKNAFKKSKFDIEKIAERHIERGTYPELEDDKAAIVKSLESEYAWSNVLGKRLHAAIEHFFSRQFPGLSTPEHIPDTEVYDTINESRRGFTAQNSAAFKGVLKWWLAEKDGSFLPIFTEKYVTGNGLRGVIDCVCIDLAEYERRLATQANFKLPVVLIDWKLNKNKPFRGGFDEEISAYIGWNDQTTEHMFQLCAYAHMVSIQFPGLDVTRVVCVIAKPTPPPDATFNEDERAFLTPAPVATKPVTLQEIFTGDEGDASVVVHQIDIDQAENDAFMNETLKRFSKM